MGAHTVYRVCVKAIITFFLSLKYCWTWRSVPRTLYRCLLSVMKVLPLLKMPVIWYIKTTEKSWFGSWLGFEVFLFIKTPKSNLGWNQPPIQGIFRWELCGRSMKLYRQFPHMPSRRAKSQLSLYFFSRPRFEPGTSQVQVTYSLSLKLTCSAIRRAVRDAVFFSLLFFQIRCK
jgi:hypothetical protein